MHAISLPKSRPVSLTCLTSKVLEHIVTSQMTDFAEHHSMLFQNQHGFRSCEKQLLELACDVAKELDNGKKIDAGVLDFSKESI